MKVKVTQSCPTLCDPRDYTVHGILQAGILQWVAFPCSRDLPDPGIEPESPALQADSLPTELLGKPIFKFRSFFIRPFSNKIVQSYFTEVFCHQVSKRASEKWSIYRTATTTSCIVCFPLVSPNHIMNQSSLPVKLKLHCYFRDKV